MAHNPCDGDVGYIVLPQIAGSRKIPSIPSRCLLYPAIEIANIQTGVWERQDGRRCESREWRFVDVHDLLACDVYAQPFSR